MIQRNNKSYISATKQGEPGAAGEEGLQGKDGIKVNYTFNIMIKVDVFEKSFKY